MSDNLYPTSLRSDAETTEFIDRALNESRVKEMFTRKDMLERQLKHHKSVKKRWDRCALGLKISGGVVLGGTTIAGVICGTVMIPTLVIPIVAPNVPIIIGAIEGAVATTLVGFEVGVIRKKKAYHKEKIKLIQSYLDRASHYIEKARQDGIITMTEIEGFTKLMEECRGKLEGVVMDDFDITKLQKQLKKEVNKEAKEALKKEIIEERKEELRSKLAGNGQKRL